MSSAYIQERLRSGGREYVHVQLLLRTAAATTTAAVELTPGWSFLTSYSLPVRPPSEPSRTNLTIAMASSSLLSVQDDVLRIIFLLADWDDLFRCKLVIHV